MNDESKKNVDTVPSLISHRSSPYFTLLGLTPAFDLDLKSLETAYFFNQKLYHPDRFVRKTPQERVTAASRSADINAAYHTLKNPLKRAQYLLHLQGIEVGTDHDSVRLAQATLMEAMELREQPKTPDALQQMIDESLGKLSEYYKQSAFDAMAQETLRLRYLMKAKGA